MHVGTLYKQVIGIPMDTYCAPLVADIFWSPAGKGLTSGSHVFDVLLCFCHFPLQCPGLGVYLIVSIPDICLLPYFVMKVAQLEVFFSSDYL